MKLLANKVALITGASRGLGAEIANVYAEHGATVWVNYFQSEAKAAAVVQAITEAGGSAHAVQGDVTDEAQVSNMVETIVAKSGRLDIVVNNALPTYRFDATAPYTSIESLSWSHMDQQLAGAIRGAFHTTKAALPTMKAQGYGKIVNVSTNLVYNPVVTYYDYTTAKAGLLGLTRNLAAELGQHGIRVNVLAGGLLETTDASSATSPEIFQAIASTTPLRKTTTVRDFAEASVFFASEMSDAITGQSISIDGGLTMP
ncbi:MAG: 3-oxoacyl-ACP reductase [Bacteroidota bacterium]